MSQSLNIVKNKLDELPNNIEAEQSVIGSVLLSNEIFDDISLLISSRNFYDPIHKKIFEALEKLIYGGLLANPITLKNYFEKEKDELNIPEYLVKITKFSTSSRQAIEYSKLIFDLYVKRELIKISNDIIDQAKLNDLDNDGQKIIENYEKSLFDLAEKGSFSSSLIKFDEAMRQTIEMASNAYKNEEGIVGVPTGLRDLDDRLGGLHKSDLIIIAGRPSMGKTALATNIAFNAAKKIQESGEKSSIAFFSLEMSSEQLSTRILSEQSRIKSNDIRRGKISFNNGRVQEISEITQGLKALAKELAVPVLALSQLSRAVEQRDDKKPQLSDLRESGSIEQDADVVMFVFREAYYLQGKEPRPATVEHAEWQAKMNEVSHLAELIIQKQRHGPTGNVMLEFEAMFTKFKDIQNN